MDVAIKNFVRIDFSQYTKSNETPNQTTVNEEPLIHEEEPLIHEESPLKKS